MELRGLPNLNSLRCRQSVQCHERRKRAQSVKMGHASFNERGQDRLRSTLACGHLEP